MLIFFSDCLFDNFTDKAVGKPKCKNLIKFENKLSRNPKSPKFPGPKTLGTIPIVIKSKNICKILLEILER